MPPTPSKRRTQPDDSRKTRDTGNGQYVCKYTPELGRQICDVIRAGNYIETAAAYAGVNKSTFYEWLKRGRGVEAKPVGKRTLLDRQLLEFVANVDQALAQAEVRDLAIIGKAAEHVWQASAWRLERRMPGKYGRRLAAVDGEGNKVEVVLAFLKDDAGG